MFHWTPARPIEECIIVSSEAAYSHIILPLSLYTVRRTRRRPPWPSSTATSWWVLVLVLVLVVVWRVAALQTLEQTLRSVAAEIILTVCRSACLLTWTPPWSASATSWCRSGPRTSTFTSWSTWWSWARWAAARHTCPVELETKAHPKICNHGEGPY